MKRTDNQKHHKHWIWWSILAIGTVVIICVAGYMAGRLSTVSKNSQSAPQTPVKIISKNDNTVQSNVDIQSKKAISASASSKQVQLWNVDKTQQLESFMQKWGTQMNQVYQSYGPTNNTNFYGIELPAQFDQLLLKVNDQPVSMAWSYNGKGNADYNVVAIYCDSQTAPPMGAHVYLFTIHNSSPVVLITQQTKGNVDKDGHNSPEDGLHFKPTANQDLANGFAKIITQK